MVLGGTAIIGGRGSVVGTLIGALLLGVLNNGLNMIGVDPYVQNVIKGVIILLAIYIGRERRAETQYFAIVRESRQISTIAAAALSIPNAQPRSGQCSSRSNEAIHPSSYPSMRRPFSDRLRKVTDQRGTSIGAMLCSQRCRASPLR